VVYACGHGTRENDYCDEPAGRRAREIRTHIVQSLHCCLLLAHSHGRGF